MDLAAVVLAGGRGTRLQALVSDRPKPLAPVAGRPFLSYLLDQLADASVPRVVLSTGYLAEQFESVISSRYRGMEITFAQEEQPLGTGGAIRFAGGLAGADQLLVMNGDSYCDTNLREFIDWHRAGCHDVSILVAKVADVSRYGTVEFGADFHVTAFLEKRPERVAGYINAGIYLLRRTMLDEIPIGVSSIENDVFPKWLERWNVKCWPAECEFIDIGVPSDYERSHDFMAQVRP